MTSIVVLAKTGEIVRYLPDTELGFLDAAGFAERRGYEIWEAFNGIPTYMLRRPRARH